MKATRVIFIVMVLAFIPISLVAADSCPDGTVQACDANGNCWCVPLNPDGNGGGGVRG